MSTSNVNDVIRISTSSYSIANPGPGAWAFIAFDNEKSETLELRSKRYTKATNHRIALSAVVSVLESYRNSHRALLIESDSEYVVKGITESFSLWKANNWCTEAGKLIENADLWERLDALVGQQEITWRRVKKDTRDSEYETVKFIAGSMAAA